MGEREPITSDFGKEVVYTPRQPFTLPPMGNIWGKNTVLLSFCRADCGASSKNKKNKKQPLPALKNLFKCLKKKSLQNTCVLQQKRTPFVWRQSTSLVQMKYLISIQHHFLFPKCKVVVAKRDTFVRIKLLNSFPHCSSVPRRHKMAEKHYFNRQEVDQFTSTAPQ